MTPIKDYALGFLSCFVLAGAFGTVWAILADFPVWFPPAFGAGVSLGFVIGMLLADFALKR